MKEAKCSSRETAKNEPRNLWFKALMRSICLVLLVVCCFVGLQSEADAASVVTSTCEACEKTVVGTYSAPTCTLSGGYSFYCTTCGFGWMDASAPSYAALGHNYVSADTSATCTSSGTTGRTECSRCGDVGNSGTTVPATGHDWSTAYDCEELSYCLSCGETGAYGPHSPVSSGNQSATCYSAGITGRTVCSVCSQVIDSGTSYGPVNHNYNYRTDCDHIMECQWCTAQIGSHEYSSEVTTAATCTSAGVTTYTCTGCTASYTAAAPAATGHSPVSADTAATCTSAGTSGRKVCSVCGTVTAAGTETAIDASNHTGSAVNAATASVCKKYSCCGASYDTSHSMTNTSTSATCQTCSDCGYKDTSHGMANTSTSATCQTCSTCGYKDTSHNMANTGTAAAHQICSTCSYKTTTHSYTVDSGVQYSAATCTAKQKNYLECSCGYNPKSASYVVETGSALGHSPNEDDGDCTTPIECATCGETTTVAKSHTFTDDSDATCNNSGCTYERTTGYTVVYNGNGNTGGSTASSTHTIDVAQTLTANGFVKENTVTYDANGGLCSTSSAMSSYTFQGWATSAGGAKVYSDKQSVTNIGSAGSTVNLYAVWSTSPSTVTLPTPTRPGYTFKGWFTATSGGVQVGDAGSAYAATSAITLYAQWTANSYTLTYNPNGGAINPTTKSYSYNSTVSLTAPTRTGYTFKNWYFNATGTNYLNLGRQYMYTDKISIHLDAYMDDWGGFATGDMRLISCAEGGGWNIETSAASSDGYIVFTMYDAGVGYKTVTTSIKWSSLAPGWHAFDMVFNGTNMTAYVDGAVVGTTANFSSGEIGYNATNSIFVGAEAGSDASTPSSGYFTGKIANVVITNSGTRNTSAQNEFVAPAGNVALIADWAANTYTVVYDGNGNTGGSTASSTHTYDVAKNLTVNGYTKDNRVFAGWNTKADGTGTAYADNASVKNLVSTADGTITLYAQWTEETFDITYDASSLGLPEGYKIFTYIESTGTQYIKTGVKGAARWEFDIQFTDTTTRQLMGYGSTSHEYWGVQTSGKYGVTASIFLDVVAGERHFIIHNYGENGKYYLKKGASEITVSANDVSSQEYTLFGIGGNYFCKARLYDLRVFQNGVLIRHFVPCESPDGVVGLYDVVGQAFYTNAGTGEFIPSETYPDEYTPDLD